MQKIREKTLEDHRSESERRVCFYVLYVVTIFIPVVVVYSVIAWMSQFTHIHDNTERSVTLSRRSLIVDAADDHHGADDNSVVMNDKSKFDVHDDIAEMISTEKIRENSRHYSAQPHPPGSKINEILAKEMAKDWKEFGFDKTELFKYKVLLSYPKQPAKIHLKKGEKLTEKLIIDNEPAFGKSEHNGKPLYPFNAYSEAGDVTGEIVFVNYGISEDYELLRDLRVTLKGKIFLIRYGTPHPRSMLIGDALRNGAIGAIFYSDPYDYTYPGQEYPNGWMLNKHGVQRGSIYELYGEALSQGYPSKPHYYRDPQSSYKYKFRIPAQPVSADAAARIFQFMDDNSISLPPGFRGSMENVTYVLQSGQGRKVRLVVDNELVDKDTFVVCGSMYGETEPDRYVVIGNHRDAWTYGAADPVSGSAVMTEVVRVLGKSVTDLKYRPRRSVMVCSWGAEEAAMLGSTEWSEEMTHFIDRKVVAYLNVDMAVEGNWTIQIKSLDHLISSIFEAAKQVRSPENETINLFQDMCHKHALLQNKKEDLRQPDYGSPGGVSDNKCFAQRFGVSVSDYRYTYSHLAFPKLTVHNGHYHTLYDSFEWMSGFVDPTFNHHAALGKLWLKHALLIADSDIIPLDLEAYSRQLRKNFLTLESEYRKQLVKLNVSLTFAKKRINVLINTCRDFHKAVKNVNRTLKEHEMRAINDRIQHFEKHFVLMSEVGKQSLKHIVYTTQDNFYGIVFAITKKPYGPGTEGGDNVRKEVTLFVWCVDMATRSLDLSELRLEESGDAK